MPEGPEKEEMRAKLEHDREEGMALQKFKKMTKVRRKATKARGKKAVENMVLKDADGNRLVTSNTAGYITTIPRDLTTFHDYLTSIQMTRYDYFTLGFPLQLWSLADRIFEQGTHKCR